MSYEKITIRNTSGGNELYDVEAFPSVDSLTEYDHYTADNVVLEGVGLNTGTTIELTESTFTIGETESKLVIFSE